jgi:intein/homing endonuclease
VKLWDEEIMGFISYGFNKCLHKETLIETNNGFKKIKDIKIGELINSKIGWVKVKNIYKNGSKKLYKIKTKSNKEITCTLDHKLETKEGMKTLKEIIDKKLQILIK